MEKSGIHIFKFEMAFWLRHAPVYLYAAVVFLYGFFSMAGKAGLFSDNPPIALAGSAFSVWSISILFSKLMLFIIPAITGTALHRDDATGAGELLFAYPISKQAYLAGKFFSSFFIVLLLVITFLLGLEAGRLAPGTTPSAFLPFDLQRRLDNFLLILLPNIFLFAAFAFSIVSLSRSMLASFFGVAIALILRESVLRLAGGPDAGFFLSLADPLGEWPINGITNLWSLTEQNSRPLPVTTAFVCNRALWTFVAIGLLFWSFRKFSFAPESHRQGKREHRDLRHVQPFGPFSLPGKYQRSFSTLSRLKLVWLLARMEFVSLIRTGSFQILLLAGAALIFILLSQMNAPYGVRLLPATWVMLSFPALFSGLLINFVTFIYSGFLVRRAESCRMDQLVDACPVGNGVLAMARLLTVLKIQVLMLLCVMVAGVSIQVANGFYQVDVLHYFFDLFVIHFSGFAIWALAAVFVHVIIRHLWVGFFLLLLIYFGISQLDLLFENPFLFKFNHSPYDNFFLYYSDFTGHGHSLKPFLYFRFHWLLFGMLLFVASISFWKRGESRGFRYAARLAAHRVRKGLYKPALVLSVLFACSCLFLLHHAEEITGTPAAAEESANEKYVHLEKISQPRVVEVELLVDIYPGEEKFISAGTYTLENKTERAIDTLILTRNGAVETRFSLSFGHSILLHDSLAGLTVVSLARPLKPCDTLLVRFEVWSRRNTLFAKRSPVEKNGAYFTSLLFPSVGYHSGNPGMPEDPRTRLNHYRSFDSDFIASDITIGAGEGQTPLAPGELQRQWSENGRTYARYKSKRPVTNDFCFLSGVYEVRKERWKGVDIALYYHPGHYHNIPSMMAGAKATLDYCSRNFFPFRDSRLSIVAYSRKTGDFAQSFAGIIPYSEMGFLIDAGSKTEGSLHLPFTGVSHELAHQWWGMGVIPADAAGSKFITEGMAEYVSLKVTEEHYGRGTALTMLDRANRTYIRKALEDEREEPLIYCMGNDKAHIPYQKGLLSLHALACHMGDSLFALALGSFVKNGDRSGPPYATVLDFAAEFSAAMPDSQKYFLKDRLEEVTFTDAAIISCSIQEQKGKTYLATLEIGVEKIRKADGQFLQIPVDGYLEIGFYTGRQDPRPAEIRRIPLTERRIFLTFNLDEKPEKIVLDPNYLTIERNRRNNAVHVL